MPPCAHAVALFVEFALGEHDHRQPVGQQQGGGQSAEAGADHDHGRRGAGIRLMERHGVALSAQRVGVAILGAMARAARTAWPRPMICR